jgi:hypothetical protein
MTYKKATKIRKGTYELYDVFIFLRVIHYDITIYIPANNLRFQQGRNMTFHEKITILGCSILYVSSVFLLFLSFYNLSYQFTYGIEEKSLFFGRQFGISGNNGTSVNPQIAVQGNNVYVVWQDNTPGNYEIILKRILSNGTTLKERNVSKNNGISVNPQIAVQGNNVYVVWQDNTPGNYDILFKRSPNNGDGFRSVNLKNTNGTSANPQIVVEGMAG